jgi:multiple sugar transport system ATP-binding protein
MSVSVRKLRKQYQSFRAVNDVDLDVADGEFFVFLGPSGCGKTTTLRMIAGLDVPSGGEVWIKGREVTYAEPRHRDIAMAFQDFGLYPNLTVFGNIEFPLKIRKVPKAEREIKTRNIARKLDIEQYAHRKPGQISGGQRQRVSLARALVRNPHVFLMDEPLSNLDAKLRATMRSEIKQLVSGLGITTIYVTHDQIEAMSMADRIGVMNSGNIVQIASPLDLYDHPRTQFVAEFLGSPPMNLFRDKGENSLFIKLGALTPDEEFLRQGVKSDRRSNYLIGIRPERMHLTEASDADSLTAYVDFVEPLGQNTNIYADVGGEKLTIVVDRTNVKAGDTIAVATPPESLRVVLTDQ